MIDKKLVWFIPPGLVIIGIFLLSTFLAFPVQVEEVSFFDKIEHCFAYAVLVITTLIAFKKVAILSNQRALWIACLSAFYGLLLEFVQYQFFPNRFFEWKDALANVLGVVIGFAVFKLFSRG